MRKKLVYFWILSVLVSGFLSAEENSCPPAENACQKNEQQAPATPPPAKTCPSPHHFSANVSLVSDYRFRGISQTMRQPAIQGGFNYSNDCGLYLGTWASNVDGTCHFFNNTSMEWDLYGGYKRPFFPCRCPDFTYDVGLYYYYYPAGEEHVPERTHYNTLEYYIQITFKKVSVKYWQTLTNYFGNNSNSPPFNWEDGFFDAPNGSSRGSIYIQGDWTMDFCKKWNLLLHVGHQWVRHYNHISYTDWLASLTYKFKWFNAFVSYVGTNANHDYFDVPDSAFDPHERHLGAQGFVFGIIRTF